MRWQIFAIPLFALGCGLGSNASSGKDAGTTADTQGTFSLPEVPPNCPPDAGNENGIGARCTRTGNECPGVLTCSCEDRLGYQMPAGMPCFCTNVAAGSTCSNCGTNAPCCTYTIPLSSTSNITVSACFPSVCAPNNQCPAIQ